MMYCNVSRLAFSIMDFYSYISETDFKSILVWEKLVLLKKLFVFPSYFISLKRMF